MALLPEFDPARIINDRRPYYTAFKNGWWYLTENLDHMKDWMSFKKDAKKRCQCFWCEKYLLKKPIPEGPYGRKGLLLLVGGMRKEIGMQCAEASALAFFRTVSVPKHKTLSYLGIDAQGAILQHPAALKEAYEAGKDLVT